MQHHSPEQINSTSDNIPPALFHDSDPNGFHDGGPNLIQCFAESFRKHFSLPALTDYATKYSLSYGELAAQIARLHRLFSSLDLRREDKIAIMAKDSANWCVVYMAAITYGGVIVPVLSDFAVNDAVSIINHSDAKLLFIDRNLWEKVDEKAVSQAVRCVLTPEDFSLLSTQDDVDRAQLEELLAPDFISKAFPNGFTPQDIQYPTVPNEQVMVLNYTSGTTGMSKGVMISGQNLLGNAIYAHRLRLMFAGEQLLCFLPLAHVYSCAFNMLTPLSSGTHVYILGKVPSPVLLMKAFAEIKPVLIVTVPLILEKIYKQAILPVLQKPAVKSILRIPYLRRFLYSSILSRLNKTLGGNFREVIVGGAPISYEVSEFLHRIGFKLTVGYGMTECAPLISYAPHSSWVVGSSGRSLSVMEIRIEETESEVKLSRGVGEIQVRGMNVCRGYYKNPQANALLFTPDGWMRTGDLGTLNRRGDLFIKGRSKAMILGSNGQNIYPEEIELKINTFPLISESLVLKRNNRLVALILPDEEAARKRGLSAEQAWTQIEDFRGSLNEDLGVYEKVTRFERCTEPFVKTPKQSIKRFLYH